MYGRYSAGIVIVYVFVAQSKHLTRNEYVGLIGDNQQEGLEMIGSRTCMTVLGRSFATLSFPGSLIRTGSLAVTFNTSEPSEALRLETVACLLLTVLSVMPDPLPRPR